VPSEALWLSRRLQICRRPAALSSGRNLRP
jgi:hypothetical protein